MRKIELSTPDGAVENINKLGELFPQVVTEVQNVDGELERTVDFEALRNLLGDETTAFLVEITAPRVIFAARFGEVVVVDEVMARIVRWVDVDELHPAGVGLLQDLERIKVVALDVEVLSRVPILRLTGLGNHRLADRAARLGLGLALAGPGELISLTLAFSLVANTEGNGRFHSDWCSMMYPRLLLARDLLAADGAIFISIDENEANNLEKICDEVFGRANFLTRFIWRKVDSPNDNHVVITPDHEYILAYCKNASTVSMRQRRAPELVDAYNGPDENGRYWRDRLLRKNGKNSLRADRPTMYYALTAPDGSEVWPIREDGREGCWAAGPSSLKEIDARGDLIWKQRDGKWVPYTREYAADNPTKPWMTIWNDLPAMRQTKAGMKDLFGISNVFDTPKPPALIRRCMELGGLEEGEIILDFFSGSAATAHAALDLYFNEEVAAKWILVQIPELLDEEAEARQFGFKSICDLGEGRIRRAGEKITADIDKENEQLELGAKPKPYPDLGFRVLRIDSSNFKDSYLTPGETEQAGLFDLVDNVKEGRSDLDLLFEVLPKLGIPYSAKIEERMLAGKKVFFVDGDKLAACFDANVGSDTIEEMAKAKPWYAVIRDSSMADDATHANYEELFRTYSPDTVPQVI